MAPKVRESTSRKRKAPSTVAYELYRFYSTLYEEHYYNVVSKKTVILEAKFKLKADKYMEIQDGVYKQAHRKWFDKFSTIICNLGFTCSPHKNALFIRKSERGVVLLLLYVDDIIITGDNIDGISDFKSSLHYIFEMKDLGSLSYFLGLEVISSDDNIYFSQAKYAFDLLARLVGGLVYLTATRPDITYPVHVLSQFLSAPRTTHYVVALRILRYIKGTMFHGLHFSAYSSLTLQAGDSLISWRVKKQTFTARSSTETEYRALADTTTEVVLICWLLESRGLGCPSVVSN
ncbi:uncharacterized protein LOC107620994 [Arachis ipaensis]|uniref:uncharacterized protein LOC107620994 n=1 Tax=Arachis ipaensis TaxID=130454 RepID=UPI0007AF0C0E|nr:uncharacterized protein LOC107620994 [Arachis ipaensis]